MSSHRGLAAGPTVRQRYERLVSAGKLKADPEQVRLVDALDRVLASLAVKQLSSKSSALGWLFGKREPKARQRGLYVHGGVGRGKTMLMDLFFAVAPVKAKRRAHFNDFMADVHDRIGRHRAAVKAGTARGDDPIPPVAAEIAADARLLCFDEFSVTDIADAMILSRLFAALFSQGVVLVATSNVAPDGLYREGLNRGLFEPFIGILKDHAEVVEIGGTTDHRMAKLATMPVYLTPLGAEAERLMDEAWATAIEGHAEGAVSLSVKGRTVVVPRAAGRAARFAFAALCQQPLAARDYLAIAERFDTILIDNIPVLDQSQRNEAKRLILLVDVLYDHRSRLVVTAAAAPDGLFVGRAGSTEAFEFRRTASRLVEMQSADWRPTDLPAQSADHQITGQ